MDVYVAGKTQDLATVKQVQGLVTHSGHRITHNWVEIVEREGGDVTEVAIPAINRTQYAEWGMQGVRDCDLLIAVGHPRISGTIWECGGAAILGKHVWLMFWERYGKVSVFEDLPHVNRVTPQQAGERLWTMTVHRSKVTGRMPDQAVSLVEQLSV